MPLPPLYDYRAAATALATYSELQNCANTRFASDERGKFLMAMPWVCFTSLGESDKRVLYMITLLHVMDS